MRVYTSYYKHVSENPRGLILVRVSTSQPSWFNWYTEELREVYPGWDLVNAIKSGAISEKEYTTEYINKLNSLDRLSIIEKLVNLSKNNGDRDIVLLCYESPDKFCHRQLLADWLRWDIEELD